MINLRLQCKYDALSIHPYISIPFLHGLPGREEKQGTCTAEVRYLKALYLG